MLALAVTACFGSCGNDSVGKADDKPFEVSGGAVSQAETTTAETTAVTTEAPTVSDTTSEAEDTTDDAVQADGGYVASLDPSGDGMEVRTSPSASGNYTPKPSPDAPAPGDYNYAPPPQQYDIPGLTYIDGTLVVNKSYSLPADFNPGLDATCEAQFYKLQNDAAAAGLDIYLSSGFRSYDLQNEIYNNYAARDGVEKADTYSARPGYSEHQTGLAIDVNQIDDTFIGTPEAIWLEEHCHEYGFILRYPQGKQDITGYKYESWHIRYVGTDLSYAIHDSGLTLEEYFRIDSYYH